MSCRQIHSIGPYEKYRSQIELSTICVAKIASAMIRKIQPCSTGKIAPTAAITRQAKAMVSIMVLRVAFFTLAKW